MNVSVPRFEALLRKEYLYHNEEHLGEVEECVVFGASSLPGRAVGWHCLTRGGAVVFRLPISAFCKKPEAPHRAVHQLELWNAFSYDMEVVEFDFLEGMRCQLRLRGGDVVAGSYLFTLDWYGSADAEDVGDLGHKCAHVVELDEGNFALQPNNRILWREPSFVQPYKQVPDFRTINKVWRCEQHGRWLAGKEDEMFFAAEELPEGD